MSPALPLDRRSDDAAARAARTRQKQLRRKAWLLAALALAFYVGFYVWNFVRDAGA